MRTLPYLFAIVTCLGLFVNAQNIILTPSHNRLTTQEQDTVKYYGILSDTFLYETFELYPDNTFKWTSEYDLNFSKYGSYRIENNILTLNYDLEPTNSDGISGNHSMQSLCKAAPQKECYAIKRNRLILLNENGDKVRRRKDRSFRKGLSWIFGHKYRIHKIEN